MNNKLKEILDIVGISTVNNVVTDQYIANDRQLQLLADAIVAECKKKIPPNTAYMLDDIFK